MKRTNLFAIAILITLAPLAASAATSVELSTSGGVHFAPLNPSLQPVAPAATALKATLLIDGVKNNDTWNLKIRGLGSQFNGTTGAPIPVANVHWTASAVILDGRGNATVTSGSQTLSASDVTVATGTQGNKSPFIVEITFTFTINNSWTYDADTFLQSLVLTATAD